MNNANRGLKPTALCLHPVGMKKVPVFVNLADQLHHDIDYVTADKK